MSVPVAAGRPAPRPGWLRVAAGWVVACTLGAVAALALAPSGPYPVGPLDVRLRLTLQGGWTVVELPPFGALAARTHRSPLGLAVEVRGVDLQAMQAHGGSDDPFGALRGEIEAAAQRFTLRVIVVAAAGALAAALAAACMGAGRAAFRGRALLLVLAAPVVTALVLGGGMATAWATYRTEAFAEPEYSGALKSAPWVIGLAEQALRGAERLGERLAAVAGGVDALFERLEAPEAFGARPGALTVLVVSDIHNNPAAVDLLTSVAHAFQADLIIDAGDLTDWGTVVESRLTEGIDRVGVPYLLVPGNHESPALVEELAARPGIRVLVDEVHEEQGLTIAAVADPASRSALPAVAPMAELEAAGRRLANLVKGTGSVDVAVAHHPDVAGTVRDRVPVVISGHTHGTWVRRTPGGVWLNPGTTGAAGLRGLESRQVPYTLMILHLGREGDRWQPLAVDTIRASGFETGFAVERTVLSPPAAAPGGTEGTP
ncbi:MAG TPA: metallophosphoesterase [Bacillota bacterium]